MTPSGQRGVGRRVDAAEAPAVVVEDRRRADAQTGDDAAASVVAMVLQRFGHDVGGATTYDDG